MLYGLINIINRERIKEGKKALDVIQTLVLVSVVIGFWILISSL